MHDAIIAAMFKFVHAWQPGDSWEPLAADGFVGIEAASSADGQSDADESSPADAPVVSWKVVDSTAATGSGGGRLVMALESAEAATFTLFAPPAETPLRCGNALRNYADRFDTAKAMIANSPPFTSAAALWNVLEAAHHPRVFVALDLNAAVAAGERAVVLVPTLNLRIGMVRAGHVEAEVADYARRLAGIGFDGYVVTDPPAGPDRAASSIAIAAAFRAVLPPARPLKKAPVKAAK